MYRDFPVKTLSGWLFEPANCGLCQESDSDGLLCQVCRSLLTSNIRPCARCAEPRPFSAIDLRDSKESVFSERCSDPQPTRLAEPSISNLCRHCLVAPPSYRSAMVPYLFRFPADFMVHELKYRNSLVFGRILGSLLGEYLLEHRAAVLDQVDALVAVPLSLKRLQFRGFNQSQEMAYWCSKICGLEVSDSLVHRQHSTLPQTGLGRAAREENLQGVFKVNRRVEGSHILLIDDVMSTGATLDSLAKALKFAGASEVDVCAFARTPASVPG